MSYQIFEKQVKKNDIMMVEPKIDALKKKRIGIIIPTIILCIAASIGSIIFSSCSKADDIETSTSVSYDPKSPEAFVANVFESVQKGNLNLKMLTLGTEEEKLAKEPDKFPHLPFGLKLDQISPNKFESQSFDYVCSIPHPSEVLMLYGLYMNPAKSVSDFSKYTYRPKAIEVSGTFIVTGNYENGYKLEVNTSSNPISLYINLVDGAEIDSVGSVVSLMDEEEWMKRTLMAGVAIENYYDNFLGEANKISVDDFFDELIKIIKSSEE